ncbi:M48 family metallopeptidase [Gilvimarinus sp. DA14]|uniref:M48 family metallopeptidase n=1 Tax=Gilvimarinus sp. DA14 TaxID=2956798 RepID=UPI0020B8FAC3|nr:M48 family metallopeptidase [Gilvimarinus sp. DA14]UTF59632.1 M48 family metallopeptidase [Gilvimarinus sp. DA14]
MDFFQQQDIAKRNTRKLVLLLALAILSLIAVTTALFALLTYYLQTGNSAFVMETAGMSWWQKLQLLLDWQAVSGIALVVMVVVFLGGLYKYFQLSRGGRAVAEALGGHPINTNSQDFHERQLLNVVEEMAIASGTPVPPVYVMEEAAINAFAAGHTAQDAVIGVTRGCMERLSRAELQGVIAHEFSHIFHGDMRLNMRLVALLNGILLLGLIGHFMVRGSAYRSIGRSSKDNSQGAIIAIGIGLMIIGYAGTFFGNIIKAAVSRQREFLADASAVQFTRDNSGIAGALKKIGALPAGSRLEAEHSAEFSHMYFGQGVKTAFSGLMATHPPLSERIKRIQPNWDGSFETQEQPATETVKDNQSNASQQADAIMKAAVLASAVEQMGQPNSAHLLHAKQLLQNIPQALLQAAHEPYGARAIIFGLLLDADTAQLQAQWGALQELYASAEINQLQTIAQSSQAQPEQLRLPLIELATPALKELSPAQQKTFLQAVDTLIQADRKVSFNEWIVRRLVRHQLNQRTDYRQSLNLRQLRDECALLLTLLARAGTNETEPQALAFRSAVHCLRLGELQPLPSEQLSLDKLDRALAKLQQVKPLQKPALLKAMVVCIEQDGLITPREAELFRTIAVCLDCPVPPLNASPHS